MATVYYDETRSPVLRAINDVLVQQQEDGRRRHLGGSLVGRECPRELWYSFRWCTDKKHDGRLLRLFNRGHLEEFRFVDWLRMAGVLVKEYEDFDYVLGHHVPSGQYAIFTPQEWQQSNEVGAGAVEDVTGLKHHEVMAKYVSNITVPERKQIRISDVGGHFGGSLDGECQFLPGIDQYGLQYDARGLLEFKTHGEKSFKKLVDEGVRKSKPPHYSQMQVYMRKRSLLFACYMAICKNTDELYCEIILPDPEHADQKLNLASRVIHSVSPPKRIASSPTWFGCKFCDHRPVCWFSEPFAKSCRSCVFATPIEGGKWGCRKWNGIIPPDAEKVGCPQYQAIANT